MKAANTQLIEDIKKTIANIEAADFAAECREGYEEQAEENQEMVLIWLRDALELAQKGEDCTTEIEFAEASESKGGFVPFHTRELVQTYCS